LGLRQFTTAAKQLPQQQRTAVRQLRQYVVLPNCTAAAGTKPMLRLRAANASGCAFLFAHARTLNPKTIFLLFWQHLMSNQTGDATIMLVLKDYLLYDFFM
jgi:hypothetical protein